MLQPRHLDHGLNAEKKYDWSGPKRKGSGGSLPFEMLPREDMWNVNHVSLLSGRI
jgi:hypothetical protein